MKTLVITPGDIEGIGLEVSLGALKTHPIYEHSQVVLFLHSSQKEALLTLPISSESLHFIEELSALNSIIKPGLFVFLTTDLPPFWVITAAQWILQRPEQRALVTGPLSKECIRAQGLPFIGHTEILAHYCGLSAHDVFMLFYGSQFQALTLTGHIPLSDVEEQLTSEVLKTKLLRVISYLQQWGPPLTKPLGILGLNPHAGNSGLIGTFEAKILGPLIQNHHWDHPLEGPLIPDASFHSSVLNRYQVMIGLYHDQILIPFKMLHGFSGTHVSLGLPIVRVSVDHGTAFDIFNKNLANPQSMIDSIQLALKLLHFKSQGFSQ